MDCRTCKETMAERLGARRPGSDPVEPALQQHLSACPSCRTEYEELSKIVDALTETEYHDPPSEYWESFPARVRAGISNDRRRRLLRRLGGLAAAAMLVLAVAGAAVVHHTRRPATAAAWPPPALPESIEAAMAGSVDGQPLSGFLSRYDEETESLKVLAEELEELAGFGPDDALDWTLDGDSLYDGLDVVEPEDLETLMNG